MFQEAPTTKQCGLPLQTESPAVASEQFASAVCGVAPGSDRTRVVHLSLGTNLGGMEKLLVEFARLTDRERFELAFISLEAKGRLAGEIEQLKWPVHALDKSPGLKPRVITQLVRLLRRLRPNVLHTHNTAALIYGGLAGSLARVPRIIHTRHGQRFQASARQTWLFRFLSKLTYRVISVSEDGRQLSVKEGVPADRGCVIYNGVDLSRFPYVGPSDYGPAVLVARLSPEKDVATLIQAAKQVTTTLESPHKFRLAIVGDGDERLPLESLSRALGLGTTIEFLGERKDIAQQLANASMFVLPSVTEGVSLTLLEAMARGLPVIATRVGGNPEVVVDGQTGFIVPAQDPSEMAVAIVRLYQDPALGKDMGWLGRRRVEQHFSIQKMVQEYEQQYVGTK